MTRDAWCQEFEEALAALRPHLAPTFGASRALRQIALMQHGTSSALDPRVAAQRYHAAQPLKPSH